MAKAARSVRVIVPPVAIVLTLRPGAVDRERKSDGETRQGVATRSVRTTVFTLEDPCSCHAAMNSPRGVTATSGPRGEAFTASERIRSGLKVLPSAEGRISTRWRTAVASSQTTTVRRSHASSSSGPAALTP